MENSLAEDMNLMTTQIAVVAQTWLKNLDKWPRILYPDVIMRAKSLLASTLAKSYPVNLKEKLKFCVNEFVNSQELPTEEDISSYADMMLTCISSTTVPTQTNPVGVTSSKKRKLCQEFDVLTELEDMLSSETPPIVTGKQIGRAHV